MKSLMFVFLLVVTGCSQASRPVAEQKTPEPGQAAVEPKEAPKDKPKTKACVCPYCTCTDPQGHVCVCDKARCDKHGCECGLWKEKKN